MRYDALLVMLGLLFSASPASAQVSIDIGLPSVSIGINLPSYPELVVVPDYPVYYAPRGNVNLFFYDGMYWVYTRDNWYASTWYNGPWGLVGPEIVPVFVLRIPVRYYRQPPVAWVGWQREAPPRWGERWGHDWEQRRGGWDRWDRRAPRAPAPLPVYQRQYSGNRYPRPEQQPVLERERYRYQAEDPVVRQVQQRRAQPQQGDRRQQDNKGNHGNQRSSPPPQPNTPAVLRSRASEGGSNPAPAPQAAPAVQRERPQAQPAERRQQDERRQPDKDSRRSTGPAPQAVPAIQQKATAPQPAPATQQKQQPPSPAPVRHEQPEPRSRDKLDRSQGKAAQNKGDAQEQGRGQEKGQERGQDQERGQGRNR